MASIDPSHGLALFFEHWKATGSLDRAVRAAYGMTLVTFERDWQQRTRRRYGGLALFSDLTLASVIVLIIITPLYVSRRRRDRKRLQKMRETEAAAEEAARRSALEELLGEEPR
jgi:type II secretory pathway component PulM